MGAETRREYRRLWQERWRDSHRDHFRTIIRAFLDQPCVDCGHRWPIAAMHPDHVRGVKRGNISRWSNGTGTEAALRRELEKCDPRCANCHAIRHASDWRLESSCP